MLPNIVIDIALEFHKTFFRKSVSMLAAFGAPMIYVLSFIIKVIFQIMIQNVSKELKDNKEYIQYTRLLVVCVYMRTIRQKPTIPVIDYN